MSPDVHISDEDVTDYLLAFQRERVAHYARQEGNLPMGQAAEDLAEAIICNGELADLTPDIVEKMRGADVVGCTPCGPGTLGDIGPCCEGQCATETEPKESASHCKIDRAAPLCQGGGGGFFQSQAAILG